MKILKMEFQMTVSDLSVYPDKKLKDKLFDDGVQKKITCGKLYGELIFSQEYHNDNDKSISHKIKRLWVEDNMICTSIEILDNTAGAILKGEIQENGFKNIQPKLNYDLSFNEEIITFNTIDFIVNDDISTALKVNV